MANSLVRSSPSNASKSFADPDVTIDYDLDRNAAIASRKTLLAEAAAQGFLVGGAHISFPGLGHVSVDARGLPLDPRPYSAALRGTGR
jgi:hypothetical protein